MAELSRADVQHGHEDRAQRRHHHEVEDHRELQKGQHGDEEDLVPGERPGLDRILGHDGDEGQEKCAAFGARCAHL
jgi:hypothetical protein